MCLYILKWTVKSLSGGGTSLVAQWLRPQAPNAGGLGSIPGQGTRSHTPLLKVLHATMKTRRSQVNEYIVFKVLQEKRQFFGLAHTLQNVSAPLPLTHQQPLPVSDEWQPRAPLWAQWDRQWAQEWAPSLRGSRRDILCAAVGTKFPELPRVCIDFSEFFF